MEMDIDMDEGIKTKPPTHSSPAPRRKINRQNPVPKRRHSSPVTVKRSKTLDSIGVVRQQRISSSDEDSSESRDCVYAAKRTTSLRDTTRKKSEAKLKAELIEEKKRKFIANRRSTIDNSNRKMYSSSATQCHCRTHKGALRKCRCHMLRQRVSQNITESELMEKETKLVVLEYLSSLSADQLTAQTKRSRSSMSSTGSRSFEEIEEVAEKKSLRVPSKSSDGSLSPTGSMSEQSYMDSYMQTTRNKSSQDSLSSTSSLNFEELQEISLKVVEDDIVKDIEKMKESKKNSFIDHAEKTASEDFITPEEFKRERRGSGVKYNTVTIGEYEHNQLLEMIRLHKEEQGNPQEMTRGTKLARSRSDVSEEKQQHVRGRLRALQEPVEEWLDTNSRLEKPKLFRAIKDFDKSYLKEVKRNKKKKKKALSWNEKKNKTLSLKIPKDAVPPAGDEVMDADLFTPETIAVNKLELISQEIMANYPGLLENPISQLMNLAKKNDVNYDGFSQVAKPVFDMKLTDKKITVFSRAALVLYMVRETLYLGNLNDKQIELLVEHSTTFFKKNAVEKVQDEGGWEGALGDEIFYANGMTYDDIESTDEECLTHGERCDHDKRGNKRQLTPDDDDYDDDNDDDLNTDRDSVRETVSQTIHDWTPYGVAALSVGIGLLYSYAKT